MIVDAPGPVLRRGDEFRGIILRNDAVRQRGGKMKYSGFMFYGCGEQL